MLRNVRKITVIQETETVLCNWLSEIQFNSISSQLQPILFLTLLLLLLNCFTKQINSSKTHLKM